MVKQFFTNVAKLVRGKRLAIAPLVAAAFFMPAAPAQAQNAAAGNADVRALFASWEQNDRQRRGVMAVPSGRPITDFRLTSSFGTRNDPFGRGRRRHNGLDMASPRGTPIHATADGIVGRAQWVSGYGKYVEINHGNEIQTRYAHMSQIMVSPGARVRRGQVIGLVGSTGRSTGNHLHYEVRIEGRPINPVPFLQSEQYLAQLAAADNATATAVGGGSQ